MKIFKITILAVIVAFSSTVNAQDIIKAPALAKIYKSADVVVVSARKATDYKKLHIPGSVNVPHTELYKEGPVKSMLKPASEIAAILGKKGIDSNKKIVVYDEGSGKYSGRLYWILKYMGAKDVKVLDGNMKAWRASRKPVTAAAPKVSPAKFAVSTNAACLAKIADVKKAQGGSGIIVDVRAPDEFAGTKETKLRKGFIPGAINIEFKNILNKRGQLKSAEELKALFAAKGISADKPVILYCESSVRAGIVYMALTSALGYKNVKVYDGAYLEWQADAANKVG